MNPSKESNKAKNLRRTAFIVFGVLLLDQGSKFWVKTHMFTGEEYRIFDWFLIHFTENNGMAFGFEFGGTVGKAFLSIFRIVASIGIGWYLLSLIKKNAHFGIITCFSLIFAGAVGNIIDSTFYGVLFSDDINSLSHFSLSEGGYSGLLHGRVVDMLYFPIVNSQFPSWFPFFGGESFQFFRPIFNIADSSITIGVLLFMFFQKKFTMVSEVKKNEEEEIELAKQD